MKNTIIYFFLLDHMKIIWISFNINSIDFLIINHLVLNFYIYFLIVKQHPQIL